MRVMYVSHPFQNKYSNYKRIQEIVDTLNTTYVGKYVFICPVLEFGRLYGSRKYEDDIQACLELLDRCDGIIMCGDWLHSDGCVAEYRFAKSTKHLTISELASFLENID